MKVMSNFLLCLLVAGCVAPAKKASKTEYLNKKPIPSVEKSEVIKKDLTRSCQIGSQRLEVYPVTGVLIATEEAELGRKNMDNESQIKKRIEEREKFFLKGFTCFNLNIATVYGIDSAKWENWRAKLETKDGNLHELQLRNMNGVQSVPFYEIVGTTTIWNNNTYACVNKELDLLPPYKVHSIPQFGDEDLKSCTVEWL